MFKWFQARPPSRGKTVPILRTRKFEGGPWEDDASSAPENPRSPTGTSWLEKKPTVLDRHVGRRCRLPDHAGRVALWRCLQTLLQGLPHGPDLVLRSRQGVCHWAPGEAIDQLRCQSCELHEARLRAGALQRKVDMLEPNLAVMVKERTLEQLEQVEERGEKAAGCSQRPCEKSEARVD